MNDEPATFRATAPFRRRASLAIEISCRLFSAVTFRLATSPHSEAVPQVPGNRDRGIGRSSRPWDLDETIRRLADSRNERGVAAGEAAAGL